MMWSISTSKLFTQCQRKWYYSAIVANGVAKDPLRREAHLLKQLRSIEAWRGSLVDTVIEKCILRSIRYGTIPSEQVVRAFSDNLMNRQLEFGRSMKHRLSEIKKSKAGDAYCAFYDLEYGGTLDEKRLQRAQEEVYISLKNVLSSDILRDIAKNASHVMPQRRLLFQLGGSNVVCHPDLLAFFDGKSPMIVDWKVHGMANSDYWLQLGLYGIALLRANPHKDFPRATGKDAINPEDIHLIEYQLLKDKEREYRLTPQDIIDIEDHVFSSLTQINSLVNGRRYKEIDASQFQTARFPGICGRCQFKKLCFESDSYGANGK